VVAGDVEPEELRGLAESAFGEWEGDAGVDAWSRDAMVAHAPPAPEHPFALVHKPGAAQTELRIGHVGVARDTPDYHALIVLNMVLGGQFVSRVNLKLRQEKGYTYGARTSFDFRRGPGPFLFQSSVQSDATADAIGEAVGEMEAIRGERPPTPEELDVARAALTRGYVRNFETAEQLARAMAQLVLYRLPDDSFDTFVTEVWRIDAEQTVDAARRHLVPDRLLTAMVGDADAIKPQLVKGGLGEPVSVTAGV
jgi:predicted Zn-dependent peptidase